MTFKEFLKSLICKEEYYEPLKLGTMKYDEVIRLLNTLTSKNYISDTEYSLTSREEAEKIVKQSQTESRKWTKENHDCDNFSFALQGYWSKGLYSFPFGIAWSNNHAFNIFIDNTKQIWIVEPQNSKFYTIEQAKEASVPNGISYFPIRFILM